MTDRSTLPSFSEADEAEGEDRSRQCAPAGIARPGDHATLVRAPAFDAPRPPADPPRSMPPVFRVCGGMTASLDQSPRAARIPSMPGMAIGAPRPAATFAAGPLFRIWS